MTYKNCTKCKANYSIGKHYGDSWNHEEDPEVETEGLCDLCNPDSEIRGSISKLQKNENK